MTFHDFHDSPNNSNISEPAMKTKKRQFKPSKVHVLFSVLGGTGHAIHSPGFKLEKPDSTLGLSVSSTFRLSIPTCIFD